MWDSFISNKELFSGIFGAQLPSTEGWLLVNISLEASDTAYLIFEKSLSELKAPKRWLDKKCDTVQLRFFLFGVSNIEVHGNLREAVCNFSIAAGNIDVARAEKPNISIVTIASSGIRVEFFPYQQSEYDSRPKWTAS